MHLNGDRKMFSAFYRHEPFGVHAGTFEFSVTPQGADYFSSNRKRFLIDSGVTASGITFNLSPTLVPDRIWDPTVGFNTHRQKP